MALEHLIERLAAFESQNLPVVSLYLNAQSDEHGRHNFRLLDEYRADGLAVAGVPQTLAALSNGQVEELIITSSPTNLQFDKAEVKEVLTAYGSDGEHTEELDKRTVADELIRRATQLSSARVTFIEDDSMLKNVGGVGALLRYPVSTENAAPYEQRKATSRAEAMIKMDSFTKEGEGVGQRSTKERSQAQGQEEQGNARAGESSQARGVTASPRKG
jgi:peptide subunit release factor 1 (eRF1)